MIQKWVIQMAISFVMRQLSKWGESIDWAKVKADVEERVRALVPGEWFDSEAVAVVMALLDAAASVLSATADLEKIVKLAVDGKFPEAWAALRDLILGSWQPSSAAEHAAFKCVADCETI